MKYNLCVRTRLQLRVAKVIVGGTFGFSLLKNDWCIAWQSLQKPDALRTLLRINLNISSLATVTIVKQQAVMATALTVSDPLGLASGGLQLLAQTKAYNQYIRRDRLIDLFAQQNPAFTQQNERKIYTDKRAELLSQAERLLRWSPFEFSYVSLREVLNIANGLTSDPFRWGLVLSTALLGTLSQGFYEVACSNECEAKIESAGGDLEAILQAGEEKKWCFVAGSFISVLSMGLSLAHPVLGKTGFAALLLLGLAIQYRVYRQTQPLEKRRYKPTFFHESEAVKQELSTLQRVKAQKPPVLDGRAQVIASKGISAERCRELEEQAQMVKQWINSDL